jgi:hypothetical protein
MGFDINIQYLGEMEDMFNVYCVMSSKIPGFYRYSFPEKTVGNSRVLPPPITALVM